jgi:molybdopterin converting factor small subunit
MKVEVQLFASLRCYMPEKSGGNPCTMEIDEGTAIGDLLDQMKVPPDAPKAIFLNGIHAKRETVLKEGDRLGVFPPVAGG